MRAATAVLIALANLSSAGAAAQTQSPKILVTSQHRGSSPGAQVEAITGAGQVYVEAEARKKFPCYDIISSNDLQALLQFARDRQLLGTPGSEQDLANIGASAGRDYILHFTVVVGGNNIFLSAVALSVRKATAVARHTHMFPIKDEKVTGVLQQFAREFIDKVDIPGPKCQAFPWVGTVTMRQTRSAEKAEPWPPNAAGATGTTKRASQHTLEAAASAGYAGQDPVVKYKYTGGQTYSDVGDAVCYDENARKLKGSHRSEYQTTTTVQGEAPFTSDLDPEAEELHLEIAFTVSGKSKTVRHVDNRCGDESSKTDKDEEEDFEQPINENHTVKVPPGADELTGTWSEQNGQNKTTWEWRLRRNKTLK